MNLFAILRRDGFADGAALEEAAGRSTKVGDEMESDIRWVRSYVLDEGGGALGTICIYQATSEEAIRKHAAEADLPVGQPATTGPAERGSGPAGIQDGQIRCRLVQTPKLFASAVSCAGPRLGAAAPHPA